MITEKRACEIATRSVINVQKEVDLGNLAKADIQKVANAAAVCMNLPAVQWLIKEKGVDIETIYDYYTGRRQVAQYENRSAGRRLSNYDRCTEYQMMNYLMMKMR